MMRLKEKSAWALILVLLWCVGGAAFAQSPPSQTAPGGKARWRMGPPQALNDLQQLIEAFYLSRMQEELKLSDEQFAAVIPTVKNYLHVRQEDARHKHQVEQELNRLTNSGAPDDQIQAKLKEFDQVKQQSERNLEAAQAEIDSKLDVRQQALFREYQQRTDQRISRMIQQIRQGRRMRRLEQNQPPRGMRQPPLRRPDNREPNS